MRRRVLEIGLEFDIPLSLCTGQNDVLPVYLKKKLRIGAWLLCGLLGVSVSASSLRTSTYPLEEFSRFGEWQIRDRWEMMSAFQQESRVLSESLRAELRGSVTMLRSYGEGFRVRLVPAFRLVSGRTQDLFGERLPKDKLYAEEFAASAQLLPSLCVDAGALDQARVDNDLVVSARPFPGVAVRYEPVGQEHLHWALWSEYAVPTSYTLDTEMTQKEAMPTFLATAASLRADLGHDFRAKAKIGYFQYRDLPSQVAMSSRTFGNSVDQVNPGTAVFRYDFEGLTAGLGLNLKKPQWTWGVQVLGIRNFAAPDRLNQGVVSQFFTEKKLKNPLSLSAQISVHRVEPDTAPALYSSEVHAANRVGTEAELSLRHRLWNLRFALKYLQDSPLYANGLMGDRQAVFLSVGNWDVQHIE